MNISRHVIRATVICTCALVLSASVVSAADSAPYMVKNVRPGSAGSNPSDLTAIGSLLYFTAADGKHGREPWVSDGTSNGTHLLRNISPGSYSSNARDYTLVGNRVFFTAQDGNGRELWVTDGTAAGTVRVKDIRAGDKSSKPTELTAFGNMLVFSANDGPHGQELWTSNGTETGTVMVTDLQPGKLGSDPSELTIFNDRIYFVVPDPAPGVMAPCCALYRTDGTPTGTSQVVDKNGQHITLATDLTVSGSLLYFSGSSPANNFIGSYLWRTNGTGSGTRAISADIFPENLTDVDGTLFFTVQGPPGQLSELWKSEGSKTGTVWIADVWTPSHLTAVQHWLYFVAMNPDGWEAHFVSDGTAAGTAWWHSVKGGGTAFGSFTDVQGRLFFTLFKYLWNSTCPDGDCSLYSWDQPIVPYAESDSTSFGDTQLTVAGGTLFYSAIDAGGAYGRELWAYQP